MEVTRSYRDFLFLPFLILPDDFKHQRKFFNPANRKTVCLLESHIPHGNIPEHGNTLDFKEPAIPFQAATEKVLRVDGFHVFRGGRGFLIKLRFRCPVFISGRGE